MICTSLHRKVIYSCLCNMYVAMLHGIFYLAVHTCRWVGLGLYYDVHWWLRNTAMLEQMEVPGRCFLRWSNRLLLNQIGNVKANSRSAYTGVEIVWDEARAIHPNRPSSSAPPVPLHPAPSPLFPSHLHPIPDKHLRFTHTNKQAHWQIRCWFVICYA